jgi:ATP:ADP antiporter, AAA family
MARDFQAARIKIILDSEIGDIAWNIKTTLDIPKETDIDLMIIDAFLEEDRRNYDNLFILLSMIYDSQNILLIKENIQDGTSDSITFAVEMMDVFVEDELKPKLFPVLDDLTVENKLKKLNDFYPPEDFESYEDLLLQVINRDYNRINRYTKALALYRICQMPDSKVSDDIIANLFNPDPFILQTAAFAIYTIDTDAYHKHTLRLKPTIKKDLDKAILPPVYRGEGEDFHQKLLLIERVLFLKKVEELKQIPGELITHMAEKLDEIRVNHGTVVIGEGDGGDSSMYVIVEGNVDIYEGDVRTMTLTEGGLFGHQFMLISDRFNYTALARNECTLLELKKQDLVDFISKHIEVLTIFVDIMNHVKEKEEQVEISDILLSV